MFLDAVDVTVESIANWPGAGTSVDGLAEGLDVRRAPVGRFPYPVAVPFRDEAIYVWLSPTIGVLERSDPAARNRRVAAAEVSTERGVGASGEDPRYDRLPPSPVRPGRCVR